MPHRRLIVTAGPTREWLDPVRFISNPSSGKMGWSIANAGATRFEEVFFISGPGHENYRTISGKKNISVETTEEMLSAVVGSICDGSVLIMAAAPADYTPLQVEKSKIKKKGQNIVMEFRPTPDILMHVAQNRPANFLAVGFAAETDNVKENALSKLKTKSLDLICANQVFKDGVGFGADSNTLMVFDRSGEEHTLGPASKDQIGRELIEFVLRYQLAPVNT